MNIPDGWEAVIGLEVHCQLRTQTKIFSAAPTAYGAEPNTHVNEVDMGLPGVLPVLNETAVEFAVRAGLALGSRINQTSRFARKNYFYPDLPKGYQISQDALPICVGGHLDIEVDGAHKRIQLTRIHMEEDAGKSSHIKGAPFSLVDLNRAGVPLIEIVSEPDLRNPAEVVAYLKELHTLVRWLGVCDGNMEEGSFRCDANVSVRPTGDLKLGTRCELKNINSFKFVKDAVIYEIGRQVDVLEDGGAILQQTRLYNPDTGLTHAMRSKEESHDYRYFPDPDLPELVISNAWLQRVSDSLPELPAARRARYQAELELSAYDAGVLCAERAVSDYFEQALSEHDNAKGLANWVINEVLREWSDFDTDFALPAAHLGMLVRLVDEDVISGKIAKQVFADALESGESPESIVEKKGLRQITDTSSLEPIIERLVAEHPEHVADYRAGKTKVVGWFVGQVMRETRGKANPQLVNELLHKRLSDD